jgi:hypothetical protein
MKTLIELNEHFQIVLEEVALLRRNSLDAAAALSAAELALLREHFDSLAISTAQAQGCLNAALAGRSGLASKFASLGNTPLPSKASRPAHGLIPAARKSPGANIQSQMSARSSRKSKPSRQGGNAK